MILIIMIMALTMFVSCDNNTVLKKSNTNKMINNLSNNSSMQDFSLFKKELTKEEVKDILKSILPLNQKLTFGKDFKRDENKLILLKKNISLEDQKNAKGIVLKTLSGSFNEESLTATSDFSVEFNNSIKAKFHVEIIFDKDSNNIKESKVICNNKKYNISKEFLDNLNS